MEDIWLGERVRHTQKDKYLLFLHAHARHTSSVTGEARRIEAIRGREECVNEEKTVSSNMDAIS